MKKSGLFIFIGILTAGAAFAQAGNGIFFTAHVRTAIAPFMYQSGYTHRTMFNEVVDEDGEGLIGFGAPNALTSGLTELYVRGATDYVGFNLGIGFLAVTPGRNTSIGAYAWVKPLGNNYLKVSVGNVTDLTLQGKVGTLRQQFEYFTLRHAIVDNPFAENANFRIELLKTNWENEGIFERFWSNGGPALMLSSEPVKNLFIGAMVKVRDKYTNNPNDTQYGGAGIPKSSIWFNNTNVSNVLAKDAFRFTQVGVGYNFPGIGFARLQFFGGFGKDKLEDLQELTDMNTGNLPVAPGSGTFFDFLKTRDQAMKIQGAFAYTGIEGLLVDIGATFWLPVRYEGKVINRYTKAAVLDIKEGGSWNGIRLGIGAAYSIGAFELAVRNDMNFGGYEQRYVYNAGPGAPEQRNLKSTDGIQLVSRLSPSYNFSFATLGLDFGIGVKGRSISERGNRVDDQVASWGIGASIRRSFGSAHFITGLAYTSPIYVGGNKYKYNNPGYLSIPILMWMNF